MSTNFDDKRAGAAAHVPCPVRVGVAGSDGIAGTNQDNHLEGTLAAAESSASVKDFGGLGGLGGWGGGIAGGGLAGGYGNTAEGKLIAAAFFDAYNKLVAQIQGTAGAA